MDAQKLKENVKRRLGHPQIKIELDEEDYDIAISDALRFYSRIKPLLVSRSTTQGGSYIQLDNNDRKDLIEIVACDYKNVIKTNFNFGGLIDIPFIPYHYQTRTDRFLGIMQKIDMDAQVLGYDGDWKYNENDGRIYFSPPTNGVEVAYVMSKLRNLETIPVIDEDLFRKLIEAFCREKLSDVRGKLRNIPSPAGELTLDADEQAQKAKDMKEEVKAELIGQRSPTPIIFG